jgi:repressor of nif and glnA expression
MKERNVFEILSLLDRANKPMTSGEITKELYGRGIVLTDRGTRYYLGLLSRRGFTENLGRRGRIITQVGRDELKKTNVYARINFILDKIVRMASQTDLDLNRKTGNVVVNLSFIRGSKERDALNILRKFIRKAVLLRLL